MNDTVLPPAPSMRRAALAAVVLALAAPAAAEAPAVPAAAPPPPAAKADLPPVAPGATGLHLQGKVVWFDLLTLDPGAAERFYGGLLGWTFEKKGDYVLASDAGVPVAGILRMPRPQGQTPQARWVPLISVADLGATLGLVKKQGGKVLEGPAPLGARGTYAAVSDPRGAQVVLLSSAGGDPPDGDLSTPGWLWAELWTDDPARSVAFYKEVLGYQVTQEGTGKDATWVFISGGRPRARAVRTPFDRVSAQWLPYVSVADLNPALARVKELGGRVLRGPSATARLAVISDPGGGVVVLEGRPEAPPLPPMAASATTRDAFGLEAAQRAAEADAAAAPSQAPGGDQAVASVVTPAPYVEPGPYVGLWIAPSPWWGWWGPGWWGPGWGGRPPWVGPPGWYRPPGAWPGYRPPGAWPPGYRPPGYRPGVPAPPRAAPAPARAPAHAAPHR